MTDEQQTEAEANADEAGVEVEANEQQAATFTQADLDAATAKVRNEERRKAASRYADYDDLKAKAGEKQTAEERLAELEQKYAAAEARSLRAEIASNHGISAEDRDLFLTGTDEETPTAQAKRLAERASEPKKIGNHVPNIGNNPQPPSDDRLSFVRALTGSD